MHEFSPGDILAPYDGILLKDEQVGSRVRTHMMRVPGTDYVYDGLPLSNNLVWNKKRGMYLPSNGSDVEDYFLGYAALANSAKQGKNNAKMVWMYNDRGRRAVGYNPQTQANLPNKDLIPKHGYLVATKPIARDQEILWKYQVELDADVEIEEVDG